MYTYFLFFKAVVWEGEKPQFLYFTRKDLFSKIKINEFGHMSKCLKYQRVKQQ